jgi:hypothetical protein
MARMSRLLEEALALDDAARRNWLERLAPEHQDLADALRRALLPEKAQAALRQMELLLDTTISFLRNTAEQMKPAVSTGSTVEGGGVHGAQP